MAKITWNKGLTKETDSRVAKYGKTQQIKGNKGWFKKGNQINKGRPSPNKGKFGPKHHCWKGGCREYVRHLLIKIHPRVMCDCCGDFEKLHHHHIDGDWHNNSPENIEVLCMGCHMSKTWTGRKRKLYKEAST